MITFVVKRACMITIRFVKEADDRWFADLPEYLAGGGNKENLEMIAGSREILEIMAHGDKEVYLRADTQPFVGSDELVLRQEDGGGGGYYEMKTYQQVPVEHELWLCELLPMVFGSLPQHLYISNNI